MLIVQIAQQTADAPCGPVDQSSALCEWILDRTGNEFLARTSDLLVVRPAKILLVVAIALIAVRLARRGIRRIVAGMSGERVQTRLSNLREVAPDLLQPPAPSARTVQRAEALGALLRSAVAVVIWTIAGVTVLGQLGVAVGPLVAGAGVAGVALGFGSQNLVRDLLSGIFMLVEDQYGVGDVIDTGQASGVVEGISLRSTRVRDVTGVLWHIPNGSIDRVGNMSHHWSRALLDIPVAFATDLAEARAVIKDVADELWRDPDWSATVLEEPEVWGVESLGSDGIAIRLVVKTVPLEQWNVARELRQRLKRAFDERGIEIPFPQQTVWLRGADTAA